MTCWTIANTHVYQKTVSPILITTLTRFQILMIIKTAHHLKNPLRHAPQDPWNMTCDTWHVTRDIWHVTCDMWHVTPDTWHLTHDIVLFFSLSVCFCMFLYWFYYPHTSRDSVYHICGILSPNMGIDEIFCIFCFEFWQYFAISSC